MKYTPAELATADQNVAAITQELHALVELERDVPHGIGWIDEFAHAVLDSLDPASVAVMLTIAIDQLSQRSAS